MYCRVKDWHYCERVVAFFMQWPLHQVWVQLSKLVNDSLFGGYFFQTENSGEFVWLIISALQILFLPLCHINIKPSIRKCSVLTEQDGSHTLG